LLQFFFNKKNTSNFVPNEPHKYNVFFEKNYKKNEDSVF